MGDNVPAVDLMLACSTQWRVGGLGLVGLDYVAVFRVAEILGVPMEADMLRKIGLMERLTLDRLAQEAERERNKSRRATNPRTRNTYGRFH